MTGPEEHGPWHDLTVSVIQAYSVPSFTGEVTDETHYDLNHPEVCGRPCGACGHLPNCSIDHQVLEMGTDVFGDLEPGQYKARPWHYVSPSGPWGPAEHDIGVEVVAIDDWDEEDSA